MLTNRKQFEKDILEISLTGDSFGYSKGEIFPCNNNCDKCDFDSQVDCLQLKQLWLDQDYIPYYETKVDWSKVPMDERIFVSNDGKTWIHGNFAGYDRLYDGVYIWASGKTKWTAGKTKQMANLTFYEEKVFYKYARFPTSQELSFIYGKD